MAIPLQSLSGTEVLRRGGINAQSTAETWFNFDGTSPSTTSTSGAVPTNHIITMLSIIVCEQGNANIQLNLWSLVSSVQTYILHHQLISAKETFVWDDRFSLMGGDTLRINTVGSANVDIWYSYIDQSWV